MISANEAREITERAFVQKEEETERFCDEVLSELIEQRAGDGNYFLDLKIYKDEDLLQYCLKTPIHYVIPSLDTMWEILFNAGFSIDIKADAAENYVTTWTVRWGAISSEEIY